MTERPCFVVGEDNLIREPLIKFNWVSGLAFSQRVKCAESLARAIKEELPNAAHLEISSKSRTELGKSLSAFNLLLDGLSLESVYHSSKVYEDGTQFEFLKNETAKFSKRFMRENGYSHGELVKFRLNKKDYPKTPRNAFYDWIYINSLIQSKVSNEVLEYNAFTDIEFNHKKNINCQAQALALYVAIKKSKKENYYFQSFDNFLKAYDEYFVIKK